MDLGMKMRYIYNWPSNNKEHDLALDFVRTPLRPRKNGNVEGEKPQANPTKPNDGSDPRNPVYVKHDQPWSIALLSMGYPLHFSRIQAMFPYFHGQVKSKYVLELRS